MQRRTLVSIGVVAQLIAAGVPAAWLFTTEAAAQSPQAQARSVPVFEVDPAWPKLPPQFKLGDASSFAIDAQDMSGSCTARARSSPKTPERLRPRSSCSMRRATS